LSSRQEDVDAQHVGRQLRADVLLEAFDPALVAELAVNGQERLRPLGRDARPRIASSTLGRSASICSREALPT